jgi:hypothetical protein
MCCKCGAWRVCGTTDELSRWLPNSHAPGYELPGEGSCPLLTSAWWPPQTGLHQSMHIMEGCHVGDIGQQRVDVHHMCERCAVRRLGPFLSGRPGRRGSCWTSQGIGRVVESDAHYASLGNKARQRTVHLPVQLDAMVEPLAHLHLGAALLPPSPSQH